MLMHTFYVTAPCERPDFRTVIAFLWSDSQNVDTDGDAQHPASRSWTALSIQNRDQVDELVEVGKHGETPLILRIESEQQYLAARVAFYLATHCGGEVSRNPVGEFRSPDSLLPSTGTDFDLSVALRRAAQSPFSRSTCDKPYPNLDQKSELQVKSGLGL